MTQNILTVDEITREALRVLHQKLNFVGSVDRQYDDSFAQSGAKIGTALRIRKPNKYVIRTGRTMSTQDTDEQYTTLSVSNQAGVDLNFTSAELTLSLDDFSSRIITPALAVVASYMESTCLTDLTNQVYNLVDQDGVAPSFLTYGLGRQKLQDNLAPDDGQRRALLSTTHEVKMGDALKGLFNPSSQLGEQYREGMIGRTQGFDFMSTTHAYDHTTGTAIKGDTGYNIAASQTGSTISVSGGTTTFLVGDVVTLEGCYRVHPETKVNTGELQQFVITANSGTSAATLAISPPIYTSADKGLQNVSGSPTTSGAVNKIGAGANEKLNSSLVYHKSAFTVATADLILPTGVDFAAREVYDGISLRVVRAYDINNDQFPCRVDVLFGKTAQYEQLASRIHADG
jgi:hypothetical protein